MVEQLFTVKRQSVETERARAKKARGEMKKGYGQRGVTEKKARDGREDRQRQRVIVTEKGNRDGEKGGDLCLLCKNLDSICRTGQRMSDPARTVMTVILRP